MSNNWSALGVGVCCAAAVLSGCGALFPREAGGSLPHFAALAPALHGPAPVIQVVDLHGNELSLDLLRGRPVVLQLGSYTCPVFRYRRFDMRPLRDKYANQVAFVVLYTQEAHPVGSPSPYRDEEWVPMINRLARITTAQPADLPARREQARRARALMGSNALFVVDGMDNAGWEAYGRAPSAAFVIDRQGQVVLRQPWVYPSEIDQALERLLRTPP